MSPTAIEEDPFVEVLDIALNAEGLGHQDVAKVLCHNVGVVRNLQLSERVLQVMRARTILLFKDWREREGLEHAPAQDLVETDCFGGQLNH